MGVEGWLFDVYPHRDGMVVWVLGADGRPHRLLHRSEPASEIGVDAQVGVVDGNDSAECLRSLNRMLGRYDPAVILTEWGDAFLLPQLRALAAGAGRPPHLHR